ncbi:unnamed protein product [Gongylonema pulchrum]|uniref:Aa_trans domain-containing protein n=1 Tax=Gongylonema pulchrum TaxID=637853 RepID=A0A183CUN2_9BILA|nr:unnamed protein product [Gongylonema pulchrum]
MGGRQLVLVSTLMSFVTCPLLRFPVVIDNVAKRCRIGSEALIIDAIIYFLFPLFFSTFAVHFAEALTP